MQYIKPYTYFVNKPGGLSNLLWGSLALFSTHFIPFVGQIILLGYQSDVAEDLEHDPGTEDHRDFNTNKLGEYLGRGVWPMLMQFLVGLAGLLLLGGAAAAGVVAYKASGDEPLIGVLVGAALFVPFSLLTTMVSWPMTLHAQLSRGFHFGAAVRFTTSFLGKLGGQLAVAMVVHFVMSVLLGIGGLLVCCVGIYPAGMIMFMAQEHFMMQLYRVYLDEGGEPVGGSLEELEADEV